MRMKIREYKRGIGSLGTKWSVNKILSSAIGISLSGSLGTKWNVNAIQAIAQAVDKDVL